MARKPKKQPTQPEAPKSAYDDYDDDSDGGDDDTPDVDDTMVRGDIKLRDWRDVEKYKEERLLRQLVDDSLDLDDL